MKDSQNIYNLSTVNVCTSVV